MRASGGCNRGCKVCSDGGCQGQSKHRKCRYFGSQKGKRQGGEGGVREKERDNNRLLVGEKGRENSGHGDFLCH